jgi:hypothetical protein
MQTTEQIEQPKEASGQLNLSLRMMETPDLPLRATHFPFGFPAEIRTNSECVLEQFEELWGKFSKQRDTKPIRCDVLLTEGGAMTCPPAPVHRLMLPLLTCIADAENYCIVDLDRAEAKIAVSRAALQHAPYAQYFLFGVAASCIATCFATPVHAACVAMDGRGVLLCGDSGAGKSTLAYACARSGWTYVSDDGSYILNGGEGRRVTGNCHQLRFRPATARLFPELEGFRITPRAAGKPSIELPTASMMHIACSQTVRVDFVVFLNRMAEGPPRLEPFSKELAWLSMRHVLYGSDESLARQYADIERLLTAQVFQLRYTDLAWAVNRLQSLVASGR